MIQPHSDTFVFVSVVGLFLCSLLWQFSVSRCDKTSRKPLAPFYHTVSCSVTFLNFPTLSILLGSGRAGVYEVPQPQGLLSSCLRQQFQKQWVWTMDGLFLGCWIDPGKILIFLDLCHSAPPPWPPVIAVSCALKGGLSRMSHCFGRRRFLQSPR